MPRIKIRRSTSRLLLGACVRRSRAHDANALAPMMTEDFGYRLNPVGDSGPGVFKYWDENYLWEELDGILSEKFVPKGNFMVAPPQFADENLNYDGYRAGIRAGQWQLEICLFRQRVKYLRQSHHSADFLAGLPHRPPFVFARKLSPATKANLPSARRPLLPMIRFSPDISQAIHSCRA